MVDGLWSAIVAAGSRQSTRCVLGHHSARRAIDDSLPRVERGVLVARDVVFGFL
jgi:hypothetical protein